MRPTLKQMPGLRWSLLVNSCVAAICTALAAYCVAPPAGSRDCARFESAVVSPGITLAPGQRFRVDWTFFNCGEADWDNYRAVRMAGSFGPEVIRVGPWPPETTGHFIIDAVAPTERGRHRTAYSLESPRGGFAAFWVDVVVTNQEPPGGP